MKLIVGLGNPGKKYVNTRHNVGYLAVEKFLKKKHSGNVIVKKTNTFMNDSGPSVKELCTKYSVPPSQLYIIHDDLDLALGAWKMQFSKGPKDNGGINSIEQVLATDKFWRIRVGIDNRNPEPHSAHSASLRASRGEEYVLEDFPKDEREIIDKVIDEICKKLATL